MKSCGFEILAEALEKRPCLVRIPFQFQEAIDRIHPEPDRLEMEGGDGPSKGLGFLDNLIAGGAWIKGLEFRQQQIDRGQRRSGTFRHGTGRLLTQE
jgi:hypothetical protein